MITPLLLKPCLKCNCSRSLTCPVTCQPSVVVTLLLLVLFEFFLLLLSIVLVLQVINLRRFPLNVQAVSVKIKLPKKYLQHCHILRTGKKNLSLLLLPR